MAVPDNQLTRTYDAEVEIKDAYLVAASAPAQVNSMSMIIDLEGEQFNAFIAVIDVDAIETGSGNELYEIVIQGSNNPTFASGIENLNSLELGASGARSGSAQTSTPGRYNLPFVNQQNGQRYRYVRAYTVVSGSILTGINWRGFIAPLLGRSI
jgi:hypothetical protein